MERLGIKMLMPFRGHRRAVSFFIILCVVALARPFSARSENLSPLATPPQWEALERYQETMTEADFSRLFTGVFAPHGYDDKLFELGETSVRVLKSRATGKYFTLRFAKTEATRKPAARRFMTAKTLPPAPPDQPLANLRVALDPGHIGGDWAKMEERWFQIGTEPPVLEGDITLGVAQLAAIRLRDLGAKVSLVREKLEPVTEERPDDFAAVAKTVLKKAGVENPAADFTGPGDPNKDKTLRWQKEILFYRQAEIRSRATLVNKRLRPDVVVAIHFNAEPWGDPVAPTLSDKNHFHVLVNGSYLPDELEYDDIRFEMMQHLLNRAYAEEIMVAERMVTAFVNRTKLPPYEYITPNVVKVGPSGYVYARNLLATRLYDCPVVYLEPYVMNSQEAYARIQAGEYEGTRNVGGKEQPSIFHEYADALVEGLVEHYKQRE